MPLGAEDGTITIHAKPLAFRCWQQESADLRPITMKGRILTTTQMSLGADSSPEPPVRNRALLAPLFQPDET